jgi:hypothetical protein
MQKGGGEALTDRDRSQEGSDSPMILPQITPDFAVIKAALSKVTEGKNDIVQPPPSRMKVNESKEKGLNRDIDNLLDETV